MLVLLLVLACGACSADRPVRSRGAAATHERDPSVTCADLVRTRLVCNVIEVQGQSFRYALVRRPRADRTVVLDLGGPGVAVLGAGYPRELIARLPGVNVLLVDEPWTAAHRPAACDRALTAWYLDLRERWPAPGSGTILRTVRSSCRLFEGRGRWSFTPGLYRELLTRIADRDELVLRDFYGFSFGSVRWAYASALFRSGRLVSPFPAGMDAERYLAARAAVSPAGFGQQLVGARPRSRSLPVARLDVAAAQAESLYLDPAGRSQLLGLADGPKVVGRLSDQLLGRYGEDSISSAILAYWDETCPALSGWDAARSRDFGLTGELLRMCSLQGRPVDSSPKRVRTPECVAITRGDGIVPAATTTWLRARWRWEHQPMFAGGHASSRGLFRCLGASR